MSTLALGTMTFGDTTGDSEAFAQPDAFAEAGGTLVDTADVYVGGTAETIIGKWLRSRPDDITDRVVLATKGRFQTAAEPNGIGLSRRHLDRALTASLRSLGTETIDLYQVHGWDPLTPLEETLRFADDAASAGKIRYFGLSNYTGWQIQRAVDLAGRTGLVSPVTVQPQYNLLTRATEWEIAAACEHNGLGMLPWSPLAGGVLTGKYRREAASGSGTRLGGSRLRVWYGPRTAEERTWAVLDILEKTAVTHGATVAQIALAWLLGRPAVSSVILGARTPSQLDDNLGAADLRLEPAEVRELEEASAIDIDYPYGELAIGQRSRNVDGRYALPGTSEK